MTSYSSMGARGRSHALDVNTSFRLRTIAEIRRGQRDIPFNVLDLASKTFPVPWTEIIGECGHVVDGYRGHHASDGRKIGKRRKRCHQCPIAPPVSTPASSGEE